METKFGAEEDGSTSNPASSDSNTFYTDQPIGALLVSPQNPDQSNISRYPPDFIEFTIDREIENRRLREEMVKLEAFRQQMLEEEVMRSEMMARELLMRRVGAGPLRLSLVDPLLRPDVPGVPFQSRRDGFGMGLEGGIDRRLSLAGPVDNQGLGEFPFQRVPRAEVENGGSVKIKPIIDLRVPFKSRRDGFGTGLEGGIDTRLPLVGPVDVQVFGELPFQRAPRSEVENGGSVKVKPILDLSKGQVKPSNSSVAGIKRKFEAPIPQAVEDDTPLVYLTKKVQKELKCAFCQVTVGCEKDMEAHLNGRKHKDLVNSREKAQEELKCAVCQVTYGCEKDMEAHLNGRKHKDMIDLRTKWQEELKCAPCEVTFSCEEDMEAHLSGSKHKDLVNSREKEQEELKCAVCQVILGCEKDMEAHLNGRKHKDLVNFRTKWQEELKERPKESNTDFKFYCKMCDFGTMGKEVMADHRMGDMHWTLLLQNGGCVITMKTTPDNIRYAGETEYGGNVIIEDRI